MFNISVRESTRFEGLKSLIKKGSYKINEERVKKSTSKYFGTSKDLTLDVKTQSGRFEDLCFPFNELFFLNLTFDNFDSLIFL